MLSFGCPGPQTPTDLYSRGLCHVLQVRPSHRGMLLQPFRGGLGWGFIYLFLRFINNFSPPCQVDTGTCLPSFRMKEKKGNRGGALPEGAQHVNRALRRALAWGYHQPGDQGPVEPTKRGDLVASPSPQEHPAQRPKPSPRRPASAPAIPPSGPASLTTNGTLSP